MPAPAEVVRLADERARARSARDFAGADALREQISAAGWSVIDEPDGWRLEPSAEEGPSTSAEAPSALEGSIIFDVSAHWVCEGWPEDIERAISAFRTNAGDRRMQYVVADVTGEEPSRLG